MPDSPIRTTTYYSLGCWGDGDNPGYLALNNNWDLIDSAIHNASLGTSLTFTQPLQNSSGTVSLNYAVPLIKSGINLALDWNTTNLKLTSSKLNTIQDIATTSTPQFAKIGIGGVADGTILAKVYGTFSATGNSSVGGTFGVTGATTLSSTLAVSGISTFKEDIELNNDDTTSPMIGTDHYESQTTGWNITYAGEADFRYLFANEMHVKTFIADLEQALAGGQIISKSVAIVDADFRIPTAGNTATLVVRSFDGYDTLAVFANGDLIRLRQFTRTAGQLTVADVWGTVVLLVGYGTGGFDTNQKNQAYTFTRSTTYPGTGSGTINAGTLALDYGVSGNGYYEVNSIDGLSADKSPYAQIVTWDTHPASTVAGEGTDVRARLGNLKGITAAKFGSLVDTPFGLYSDFCFLEEDVNIVGTIAAGSPNGTDYAFYAGQLNRNLLADSENFSTGLYASSTTISSQATLNPFGGASCYKIVQTSQTGSAMMHLPGGYGETESQYFCFSIWMRSDSGSHNAYIQLEDNDTPVNISTVITCPVTTSWKRYYVSWYVTLSDAGAPDEVLYRIFPAYNAGSNKTVYVYGRQLEKGQYPSVYQRTGATVVDSDGWGAWMSAGGVGGTMQDPVLKFSSYGIQINDDGVTALSTPADGLFIGNYSASASFDGTILTKTGLYGYVDGDEVFKVDTSGTNLSGWTIDVDELRGGNVSLRKGASFDGLAVDDGGGNDFVKIGDFIGVPAPASEDYTASCLGLGTATDNSSFETYSAGTFTSTGNWTITAPEAGVTWAISTATAQNGTKSLICNSSFLGSGSYQGIAICQLDNDSEIAGKEVIPSVYIKRKGDYPGSEPAVNIYFEEYVGSSWRTVSGLYNQTPTSSWVKKTLPNALTNSSATNFRFYLECTKASTTVDGTYFDYLQVQRYPYVNTFINASGLYIKNSPSNYMQFTNAGLNIYATKFYKKGYPVMRFRGTWAGTTTIYDAEQGDVIVDSSDSNKIKMYDGSVWTRAFN